jgi:DNA primase
MTESDKPHPSTLHPHGIELVDLARKHCQLVKKGGVYILSCPCCHKQDLMYIDRQKQLYHCFGCGEGGDAVTFGMYFE